MAASLYLSAVSGGFNWQISGLSSDFNSTNYTAAGVTLTDFTEGGSASSVTGIVGSTVDFTGTRQTNLCSASVSNGEYAVYGFTFTPNGKAYHAGSGTVRVGPTPTTTYTLTVYHLDYDTEQSVYTTETRDYESGETAYASEFVRTISGYSYKSKSWTSKTMDQDRTLTIYYKKDVVQYTATFYHYKGSTLADTTTTSVAQGGSITAASYKKTYSGYTFSSAVPESLSNISTNVSFNLYYTKNTYKVTISYDANGGTGAPESQTVGGESTSVSVTLSSTVPTNGSKKFRCWKLSGVEYQPGQTYSFTGSTSGTAYTLTAQWDDTETGVFFINMSHDINAPLWVKAKPCVYTGPDAQSAITSRWKVCNDSLTNNPCMGYIYTGPDAQSADPTKWKAGYNQNGS